MEEQDYYLRLIESDNININKDGFHWKGHGRTAIIYFVENHSIIPIEAEMPGVDYLDVLVYGESQHIERRYYPEKKESEIIPLEDRFRIQSLLVKWLNKKRLRHDIKVGE
jgi:hypothetical protein